MKRTVVVTHGPKGPSVVFIRDVNADGRPSIAAWGWRAAKASLASLARLYSVFAKKKHLVTSVKEGEVIYSENRR